MFRRKFVCIPIEVPVEDRCYNSSKMIVCNYFDNRRVPTCTVDLDDGLLDYDSDGNAQKPPRCRALKVCCE